MIETNDLISEFSEEVVIPAGAVSLHGEVTIPANAPGVVLFAHGSGSSRHSPRNQAVARVIRNAGIGTLLFDLLTAEEEVEDNVTGRLRFDIKLLAQRLIAAAQWVDTRPKPRPLALGLFGASTGGAAALIAAAELGNKIGAVVSRGGRPDLAMLALSRVTAPTLLIVGQYDDVVLDLNEEAFARLRCVKSLKIIPGATHLFEEKGALNQVAAFAASWFSSHLGHDEK